MSNRKIDKYSVIILGVVLLLSIIPYSGYAEEPQISESVGISIAPIISERVNDAVAQYQKVPVLIKLKDASESPHVSKMTITPDSERFISRSKIKRLQETLESSFSDKELENEIAIIHKMSNIPWVSGRISKAALNKLRNNPNVAMVVEDMPVTASLNQSGPLINRDEVHSYGITGSGVNVAVFDTGIDADHPDLVDNVVREECFLTTGCPITGGSRSSGPGSAADGDGHGTHVSGIITSSNSTYKGIAPDAGIVAIKVLNDTGFGFTSSFVAAADWMLDNQNQYNIKIINMSLGTYDVFPGDCDVIPGIPAEAQAAIDALVVARNAGIAIFASSGNDSELNSMAAPACLSSVISVGAVYDANLGYHSCDSSTYPDKVTCFSNVSTSLDLLAPGSAIMSSRAGGGSTSKDGTSMSSPHAAAVAALLLQKDPGLTVDEIESILKATGKSVLDSRIGQSFPRVDALAAINSLITPVTITVPENAMEGDGLLTGQGTVTVSPAPSINLTINLESDDTSEVSVPTTVTILAGQTSGTFDITIIDDFINDGSQTVTITASASGYTSGSDTIQVHDNESVCGTFDLSLDIGWNLVSIPFQPSLSDISTFLYTISGKYLSVWAFENGSWKFYAPGNPVSDLDTVEAGKGYWVYMSESADLTIYCSGQAGSISLLNGWNLVGYNSSTPLPIEDAIESIAGKYISVWAFKNNMWEFYAPGNPVSDLMTMDPGYGYWINMSQSADWTLP